MKEEFDNSTDTVAFTTKFVLEDNKTITYVAREMEDGAWQFFSEDEFDNFEKVARIVGLNEIMEIDPSLKELEDLKPGNTATRKFKGGIWEINWYE